MNHMDRKVLFPEITKFSELFSEWSQDKENAPKSQPFPFEDYDIKTGKTRPEQIEIGPYCSLSGKGKYGSIYVRCNDKVAESIRHNMLAAGVNDSISFEIIRYPDGTALVIARNSVIIGSRWLAHIKASSIPKGDFPAQKPKRYKVAVTRSVRATIEIEVETNSPSEAQDKAINAAGDLDFSSRANDAEYAAGTPKKV